MVNLILQVVVLSLVLLPVPLSGQEDSAPVKKAREFVTQMAQGENASAVKSFDATMAGLVSPKKLSQIWAGVIAKVGDFKGILGTRQEPFQKYRLVFVTCKFVHTKLDAKVVIDGQGLIAGLFFLPVKPPVYAYKPPVYVKKDSFKEQSLTLGKAPWQLPGTLTLPRGKGPFPGVVLVHGSGPNDRDETIGPNKPFRDLAWGLASRGIAVLRYDKRTKVHGARMTGPITTMEVTVLDALAAMTVLRGQKALDPDRVYLLGHSLGGMLAPRIGLLDRRIAGFIIMAGPTRPFVDLVLAQTNHILNLDGKLDAIEKKQLARLLRQVTKARDPRLSPETPKDQLPLGMPASFLLDLRSYDQVAAAKQLKRPIYILQGGRDYQVTTKDFAGWRKGLTDSAGVSYKLYPELNHLFVQGKGKSTPQEYNQPGHVAAVVLGDIVRWIGKGN